MKKNNITTGNSSLKAPLLSWDIFMDGYWRKMALINDKSALEKMAREGSWVLKCEFEQVLLKEGKVIVVTDPSLHIQFASSNMVAMNGYTTDEVIGKTPKMFQGKGTDEDARNAIRLAVKKEEHFHLSLLNYKKNGAGYYCNIEGLPVFNTKKKLVNYIAFEMIDTV